MPSIAAGRPSDAQKMTDPITNIPRLAERRPATHKGDAGRVGIVAGSAAMSGAAALAGIAALRGGAGLVRVCTSAAAAAIVAGHEPSLMVSAWPANGNGGISGKRSLGDEWAELLEWADVLAIGPGMGRGGSTARFVDAIGDKSALHAPVVLDADALTSDAELLVQALQERPANATVLTPHPGEFRTMLAAAKIDLAFETDDASRIAAAAAYAAMTHAVVLLKGHRTIVATAERHYVNTTGNPGMATGGMGDVLTGLIAALIGQGLSPLDAAILGARVHGAAGDALAARFGPIGFTAREVAAFLPAALAAYYGEPFRGI